VEGLGRTEPEPLSGSPSAARQRGEREPLGIASRREPTCPSSSADCSAAALVPAVPDGAMRLVAALRDRRRVLVSILMMPSVITPSCFSLARTPSPGSETAGRSRSPR
jgi:hypothetical protein